MSEKIKLNKYMYFDKETGKFRLTEDGSRIIYSEKGIICSYSGADEWIDFFTKEMINLYTGNGPYSHSLITANYHEAIPRVFNNAPEDVCMWIEETKQLEWGSRMYRTIENIIDDLPNWNDDEDKWLY